MDARLSRALIACTSLFVVFLLAWSLTTASPQQTLPEVKSLWLGTSQHLRNYDPESGTGRFAIDTGRVRLLARNERTGTIWTVEREPLLPFSGTSESSDEQIPSPEDLDDAELADIREAESAALAGADTTARHGNDPGYQLKAYDAKGEPKFAVSTDPVFGFTLRQLHVLPEHNLVWAIGLFHAHAFDLEGEYQYSRGFDRPIWDADVDAPRGEIWFSLGREALGLDSDGQTIQRFDISRGRAALVAVVPDGGPVWLAGGPRLHAYDRYGNLMELRTGGAYNGMRALEADTNGLWAVGRSLLSRMDSTGTILWRERPFGGWFGGHILAFTASMTDDGAWVASRDQMLGFDADGNAFQSIETELGFFEFPSTLVHFADIHPPELTVQAPDHGACLDTADPVLVLGAEDPVSGIDAESVEVTAGDGTAHSVSCTEENQTLNCYFDSPLSDREHELGISLADRAGNRSDSVEAEFELYTQPPGLTITSPENGLLTNEPELTVQGQIAREASVRVNDVQAPVSASEFSRIITLEEGENSVVVTATDCAGNEALTEIQVTLDTEPPEAVGGDDISVETGDREGEWVIEGGPGAAEPGSVVEIENPETGETFTARVNEDGSFRVVVEANPGDTLAVQVRDPAGNRSRTVELDISTGGGGDLPPDPEDIAPDLSGVGMPSFHEQIRFLYDSPDPVQEEVEAGAVDPDAAAVLRGKVQTRTGAPLSGVRIDIHGHERFGYTFSRRDGLFDIVANGGQELTLEYHKDGYLPVHRTVQVPQGGVAFAEDVVMIGLDENSTIVDFGSNEGVQVARGSVSEDEFGERRATILFPSDVTATMVDADGTETNLSAGTIRATEYTVGDAGVEAMPAKLPSTTGYTYAVELSVDEALAAGTRMVEFSKPVPVYVENFLEFPVGETIPSGYYDSDSAVWKAGDNGRVIEILSIDGGRATVDVSGDGEPAGQDALDRLGLTPTELEELANLYDVGELLWRVPVSHFTPWDYNLPYGPPEGAEVPDMPGPETNGDGEPEDTSEECSVSGCIVGIQGRTLGESIPISGTPFSLHYESDRFSGYKDNIIDMELTGGDVSEELVQVILQIEVGGRKYEYWFPAASNQEYRFEWDGLGPYGRPIRGTQDARVTLSYRYPCVYYGVQEDTSRAWARVGDQGRIVGVRGRCQQISLEQKWSVDLTSPHKVLPDSVGAWSLSNHHAYDQIGRQFRMGAGVDRTSPDAILTTAAGVEHLFEGSEAPFNGENAQDVRLSSPDYVAVDGDGNIFVSAYSRGYIHKISPEGVISTIAGTGDRYGDLGDGGPAVEATLSRPYDIEIGPDGNVYIADAGHSRVRMISQSGIITTVAGNGVEGSEGDGGPAVDAQLVEPTGIDVDRDGNIYIADAHAQRVRKVTPDGVIHTIAGTGSGGNSGDGGPATDAELDTPLDVEVDYNGNVYIVEQTNHQVRKVTPEGIISTIVGDGQYGHGGEGDGGRASDARLGYPSGLAVDMAGNVYVTDTYSGRVRRITPAGMISTVAGGGIHGAGQDGLVATDAEMRDPRGVAIGPAGRLFIGGDRNKVRSVSPTGFIRSEIATLVVPSADGRVLYGFDATGRHEVTVDAVTGTEIYRFEYNSESQLIGVRDRYGRVTTINRDETGKPRSIVSSDGVETELSVNSEGMLGAVTDPDGGEWAMEYSPDHLLTRISNPSGEANVFSYDADGRLVRDDWPNGGSWGLARYETSEEFRVELESGEGIVTEYAVGRDETEGRQYTERYSDGTSVSRSYRAGGEHHTLADGTIIEREYSPDPRLGMFAKNTSSTSITTPGGISREQTAEHAVEYDTEEPDDVFGFSLLRRVVSVNGRESIREYDAEREVWSFSSPEGRSASVNLNLNGDVSRRVMPGVGEITYTYNNNGKVSRVLTKDGSKTREVRIEYDERGYPGSVTDSLGREMVIERNSKGLMTRIVRPDGADVSYAYDPMGRMRELVTPTGETHVFRYTQTGETAEYDPPDLDSGGWSTVYSYNLDDDLTSVQRPDGETIDYTYDDGGRLTGISANVGQYSREYHADTGKLSGILSPGGIGLRFQYDGFLPTQIRWEGPVAGTVSKSWDENFWLTGLSVNGQSIGYSYDLDGLLTQAGDLSLNRDQASGLLEGVQLGVVTETLEYEAFAELSRNSVNVDGETEYSVSYERDDGGRITEKSKNVLGETTDWAYEYDAAGRLESVTKDGQLYASYTYDANGNRTSRTTSSTVESGTYDDQDRLQTYGNRSYEYDRNGDLEAWVESGARTEFDYDAFGNLRHVSLPGDVEIEYLIDGRNRRIGKKVSGDLVQGFLYRDQLNPVAELDGDGNVVSRFVYGSRPNVPDYMIRGGERYRLVSDHLGSIRLVVNADSGEIVQRIRYDEFGRVLEDTNPGFQPFGFAGGLYDQHTELVRFGARDYDPFAGRWTAKDPVRFAGRSLNLYGYVLNDPVNLVDPNGLVWGGLVVRWGIRAIGAIGVWTVGREGAEYLDQAERFQEMREAEAQHYRDIIDGNLDSDHVHGTGDCPFDGSRDEELLELINEASDVGKASQEAIYGPRGTKGDRLLDDR